jgi:hypothetical protein
MPKYTVTYSIKYLPNLNGDWAKLNNPLLGFTDMIKMSLKHYGVFKK